MANPSFSWGEYDSTFLTHALNEAYSEIVDWRKNTFPVPFGNAGKSFVSKLGRLYRAYAEGSALKAIALKACTVMPILLLQKPFRTSKQRDHSACLDRRLRLWKKGDIETLVSEGRSLQQHLTKNGPSSSKNYCNLARSFARLMFQGKTTAALQLLSQQGKTGVLHLDDPVDGGDQGTMSVLDALRAKHPCAQPVSSTALLE